MRTINFRAWTGKKMFYQNSQYLGSFVRRAVQQICMDTNGSFYEHESYLPNGGNIDEYLMQYTGMKDKNGVGIYEGDIIKYSGNSRYWTVYWDSDMCQFRFKCYGSVSKTYQDYAFNRTLEYRVVGNIYENPELINQ